MKNKFILLILIITFNLSYSQENNLCKNAENTIAFFNGLKNSFKKASDNLKKLRKIHKEEFINEQGEKEEIIYELFYNETHGYLSDALELFDQRMDELDKATRNKKIKPFKNRYELYLTYINSYSSPIREIIRLRNFKTDFDDEKKAVKYLKQLREKNKTIDDYKKHQIQIEKHTKHGRRILLVSHSQGSLFANNVYKYATENINYSKSSISAIYIAPVTDKLYGKHILADIDIMVAEVGKYFPIAPVTDIVDDLVINPANKILGHGLKEIYINSWLKISKKVENIINNELKQLIKSEAKFSNGFFTVTLIWDGFGDVDLHVFEQYGQHVYYKNKKGNFGELDYDNTVANGPEHYYASCDKNVIKEGLYNVAIANYRGAKGRTATITVDNKNQETLGTRLIILGDETKDEPSHNIFRINIRRDKIGKLTTELY